MVFAKFTLGSLIIDWGKPFLAADPMREGYYDDVGVFIEPAPVWRQGFGVLSTMINEMLVPTADGGVYTQEDLFCATRSNYKIGTLIKDNLRTYTITERIDHSPYSQEDLFIYKLRYEGSMENSDETKNRQEF